MSPVCILSDREVAPPLVGLPVALVGDLFVEVDVVGQNNDLSDLPTALDCFVHELTDQRTHNDHHIAVH